MRSSLVTVFSPVYNGQKHIDKSIESILNQTHDNIQFLIIDDCSTDKTPDIVTSYDDPRIEYIRRDKNKGRAYFEDMMHLMRGDFVTTIAHDDRFYQDRIQNLITPFTKNPNLVAVFDKGELIDENENLITNTPEGQSLTRSLQCPWRNRSEALVFSFAGNSVMANPLYSIDMFHALSENGRLGSKKYRAYCQDAYVGYMLLSNTNVELINKVQYQFMLRSHAMHNDPSRLEQTIPKWFELMSEMRIKMPIEAIFPQIHDCDDEEEEKRLRAESHLYLAKLMARHDGYYHNLSVIESDVEKSISYDPLSSEAWQKLSEIRWRIATKHLLSARHTTQIAWSLSPSETNLQDQLQELYLRTDKRVKNNESVVVQKIPTDLIYQYDFRNQTQWSNLNQSAKIHTLYSQKTNENLSKRNNDKYEKFSRSRLRLLILGDYFPPHHFNPEDERLETLYRYLLKMKVPVRVLVSNHISDSYKRFDFDPIPEVGVHRNLIPELQSKRQFHRTEVQQTNVNTIRDLISTFRPNRIIFWDLNQFCHKFKSDIDSLGIHGTTKSDLLNVLDTKENQKPELIKNILHLLNLDSCTK